MLPRLSLFTTLTVRSDTITITAAPFSIKDVPRRRKSSADAGALRRRLRTRLGNGSFPVKVENSPSVTLTKLSSAAREMSDKVITFIPGSSNDTATEYPLPNRRRLRTSLDHVFATATMAKGCRAPDVAPLSCSADDRPHPRY